MVHGQFLSRPRWCSLGFPYSALGPIVDFRPPDPLVCPPGKFLATPLPFFTSFEWPLLVVSFNKTPTFVLFHIA